MLGQLENKGIAVLRQRSEGAPIEAGVVRPVRDGESITGELVTLKPTLDNGRENARVCDVEVHVDNRAHKGPTRVANEAYRDGWDTLFGNDKPN